MSLRKFTVFKDSTEDQPSVVTKQQQSSSSLLPLSSVHVPLPQENAQTHSLDRILSSLEKENIDPLTGLPVPVTQQLSKKRKVKECDNVLSTKSICTEAGSSVKEKQRSELKRRVSLTTSLSKAKTRNLSAKLGFTEGRRILGSAGNVVVSQTGNKRVAAPSLSRSVSTSLVPIPEDEQSDAIVASNLTQALIDSKCRDFTVLPLADLSEAYIEGSSKESEEDDVEFRTVKEKSSFEARLRDYVIASPSFSSLPSSSSLSTSSSLRSSGNHSPGFTVYRDASPVDEEVMVVEEASEGCTTDQAKPTISREKTPVLTTPERKALYASFTFSSPVRSPSNK